MSFWKRKRTLVTGGAFLLIVASALFALSQNNGQVASPENEGWISHAQTAWKYFQPGVGVSPNTGLNYATKDYHYTTDWDLGSYILAIVDAHKIGLIDWDGSYGAADRLNRILSFLKTREHVNGLPYLRYHSDSGNPSRDSGKTNPSDSGLLLTALHKVKVEYPDLAEDVDYIVYSKTNYTALANQSLGVSFYGYLDAQGFKFFGFDNYGSVQYALMKMERLNTGEFLNIYNESIPLTHVTSEPILHGILNLNLTGLFRDFADRIFRVQMQRYEATGKLTAFSEGAYPANPWYLYEWIVQGSKDDLWVVNDADGNPVSFTPVVFTKAALGFHAVWESSYTTELVNYILGPRSDAAGRVSMTSTSQGFYEGIDEEGRVIGVLTDKTNAMIINAARYALERLAP